MIKILDCEIETKMVVGWFDVELWVVRGPVVGCYARRESGLWLPKLCGLRGRVWLIVLLKWLWSAWMYYVQIPPLLCY